MCCCIVSSALPPHKRPLPTPQHTYGREHTHPSQIEEDTDRDRYMSPLESLKYGIIDHIIGGEEAVFQAKGSTRDFPKTKQAYVSWGDAEDDGGSRGSRFVKPLEPYTEQVGTQ